MRSLVRFSDLLFFVGRRIRRVLVRGLVGGLVGDQRMGREILGSGNEVMGEWRGWEKRGCKMSCSRGGKMKKEIRDQR